MEDVNLFLLPKEIRDIIFNLVGARYLLRLESTSKNWRKISWESLHTLRFGPHKIFLNDMNLLKILNKANPLKIRSINISGEKMISTSLAKLSTFSNLISFSCRSTSTSTITSIIPLLPSVRKLDLSSRELSDVCVDMIAQNMPYLTKLYLSNSSELRVLPNITRLTKLETLNLAFSEGIHDRGIYEVCQMTNLQKLDICWLKNISGEGFEKISKLTKLIHLDISNISSVPDSYLTALLALTHLELLDVSYYKTLSDFGISIIGKLTNLTRLIFVDNRKITAKAMNYLTDLTNLNHLSLNSMSNISNDHYFSSLANLTLLRTKMSEENFKVLKNLTKMVDLSISVLAVINEEFFRYISTMTLLESLSLRSQTCCIAFDTLTCCTNLTSLEIDDCFSFYNPTNAIDDDVIERLLQLTGLKALQLRFTRDFNRLAALTALQSLTLAVPEMTNVQTDDFTQLLTLPNLGSLQISSPLPSKELKDIFSEHKQITSLIIETNSSPGVFGDF